MDSRIDFSSAWSALLIVSPAGPILGKLAVLADTSEINRVEQERVLLRLSNSEAQKSVRTMERLGELIEAAPDSIIEVDRNGIVVLVNAAPEHMFGYSREELIGKNIDQPVPEQSRERHAQNKGDYTAFPIRREFTRDGGAVSVECSCEDDVARFCVSDSEL